MTATGAHGSGYAREMESVVAPLLPLFEREQAAGRPMALAVVLDTAGSTYSKRGALLLIAESGEYAGLLSGGCLEGDLRERAGGVIDTGVPARVSYDMRGPDDLLWGLGAGCEGAMDIFLMRVSAHNQWQPLQDLRDGWARQQPVTVGIVVEAQRSGMHAGDVQRLESTALPTGSAQWLPGPPDLRLLGLSPALPPRLLLLGAGPDTLPLWQFARQLGWWVTLYDHRPAYAEAARAGGAEEVLVARPQELPQTLRARGLSLDSYAAAVVMSHHLDSDLSYLQQLAATSIPYIGLLGPAPRREKLRARLGPAALRLDGRLYSPVGLALGGRSSASIALAIVAEIQAFLNGQEGGHFSLSAAAPHSAERAREPGQ
jgi:xanthine/CO dehydrogenase XdhC/CoxF family maturation factor